MPLKCLRVDEPVFAYDVQSDAAWEQLRKENAANKNLHLLCCGADVTLRTSKLGTKHFAHARRGPCSTAPETAEHLLAKQTIVEGIRRTKWTPMPEQSGESPESGQWVADVLAINEKAKVAFEVQWSRQEKMETRQRQERYKAAGVRGLWLFRQHDFPVAKDTPAFRLVFDEQASLFTVLLPSPSYHPDWVSARQKNEPGYWQQKVELSKFVEGALSGRLHFAPVLGATLPLDVYTAETNCWCCKKKTNIVLNLRFAASRALPGCADVELTIHSFGDCLEDGARVLAIMLPQTLLKQHGIGALKPRYSKTEGRAYLSNGCIHCDALQGRFFEHELAFEMEKSFEIETTFEREWGALMDEVASDIYRWWFNESGVELKRSSPERGAIGPRY